MQENKIFYVLRLEEIADSETDQHLLSKLIDPKGLPIYFNDYHDESIVFCGVKKICRGNIIYIIDSVDRNRKKYPIISFLKENRNHLNSQIAYLW